VGGRLAESATALSIEFQNFCRERHRRVIIDYRAGSQYSVFYHVPWPRVNPMGKWGIKKRPPHLTWRVADANGKWVGPLLGKEQLVDISLVGLSDSKHRFPMYRLSENFQWRWIKRPINDVHGDLFWCN
jgi:hypothetical protein